MKLFLYWFSWSVTRQAVCSKSKFSMEKCSSVDSCSINEVNLFHLNYFLWIGLWPENTCITIHLGCIQSDSIKLQLMEPHCMPHEDLKASDREGRTSLCITFGQYLSILALFWRKILICTEKTTNKNVYKDHNRLFNLTGGFFLPQEESKAAERPSLLLCDTIDMLRFQNNGPNFGKF